MIINNKVRFMHFRNTQDVPVGHNPLQIKGGATIAWKFDESGNIVVGAPAICSMSDNYFKSAGRQIAEWNLNNPSDNKPPALVVPREEYLKVLQSEVQVFNSMKFLTKEFREQMVVTATGLLEDDIFKFVNISWFEQKLRNLLILDGNQLYVANGKVYGKQYTIKA